jgi:hypothetical protein
VNGPQAGLARLAALPAHEPSLRLYLALASFDDVFAWRELDRLVFLVAAAHFCPPRSRSGLPPLRLRRAVVAVEAVEVERERPDRDARLLAAAPARLEREQPDRHRRDAGLARLAHQQYFPHSGHRTPTPHSIRITSCGNPALLAAKVVIGPDADRRRIGVSALRASALPWLPALHRLRRVSAGSLGPRDPDRRRPRARDPWVRRSWMARRREDLVLHLGAPLGVAETPPARGSYRIRRGGT